ncbi:MAG TPA: hypothetical protein VFA18_07375, partial [Gemmataceae bacterium]|nr:hypothetical protein [Gemmataceae bacterium]
MLFSIARTKFPDRQLDSDQIQAATHLWVNWFQAARKSVLLRPTPYHATEVRLWGFPRFEGTKLVDALRRATVGPGLTDPVVELLDEDTISLPMPFASFVEESPVGRWVQGLQVPPFCGLAAMIRYTIAEWRGEPRGKPLSSATLVLVGQLQPGGLLAKAAWAADASDAWDRLCQHAVWPRERRFFKELKEYHESGTVHSGWNICFPTRAEQRRRDCLLKLLVVLPGNNRLRQVVFKLVFFTALLIPCLWLCVRVPIRPLNIVAGQMGVTVCLLMLAAVVVRELGRLHQVHRLYHAAFKRIYSRPLCRRSVRLEELGFDIDPVVRKVSQEVEALGGRHYADMCSDAATAKRACFRVYYMPRDATYLSIVLVGSATTIHMFPVRANMVAHTFFTDGSRFSTANGGTHSKKSVVPYLLFQRVRHAQAPAEVLACHRRAVDKLIV